MSSSKIETEAKFTVPEIGTFKALQRITRLGDFELTPVEVKNIRDRYLDTADRDLYRAGYACRIRTRDEQQRLTLKSLTPAIEAIHRRHEVEADVETDDPQNWAKGEARTLVLDIIGSASLETLFHIYQTRHVYHVLHQDRPVIEYSLDEVSLHQEATIDYLELEAELIEGAAEAALDRFIETLLADWPLQPEKRSKFEQGLASLNQDKRPD
jgi:inorganic triphosphatase YgiF